MVHGLARNNPGARIRVLTHEPGAELVRGDPAVTEIRTPPHGRPGAEREAVALALAERRPDLAITTTRYDGIPDLLNASGARCVTDLWRNPPPDELVGTRYLRILHAEGLIAPGDLTTRPRLHLHPAELARARRRLAPHLATRTTRPPIVLIPQAGMPVKHWPLSRWRLLAQTLSRLGHLLLATDPVPGAPVTPLPRGTLRQLAALLAAIGEISGIAVGGDTGPLRLAAAVGVPTIGLFGPTSALRYGIADSTGTDLQGLPDCPHRRPTAITEQPCWWSAQCPLSPTAPACMIDIPVHHVTRAVLRLADSGEV
ncbi:glycosyltransferase family 9 protein [Thermopolyspora sp. NPDC052614]|uniref:glycosyltransferase family 9 protein n=1 Tax=Thermopolyspora sp. NPDC052614 TaxID=3155682 RepID=UPI00341F43F6